MGAIGNIVAARSGDLIETIVDDELIGLHLDNGTCYGFNGSATRIWGMIEQPRSIGDIAAALTAEFDVAHDECQADILAVLEDLEKDRLVTLTRP